MSPQHLRELLTFPHSWGPTEWGPIPYLPDEDALVRRMERQWGNLLSYRGINSTTRGTLLVPGVQLGKLWIGIQPLLGLEGDPMRLLFERDLTPHPQYAAAYKWLQQVGVTACCSLVLHRLPSSGYFKFDDIPAVACTQPVRGAGAAWLTLGLLNL